MIIFHQISEILAKISRILVEIFLSILVICVLIQVVNRNTIKISLVWTEEIAILSFVWLAFLGASLALRNESHFSVQIFSDYLFSNKKKLLKVFVDLCIFFCISIIFVQGIKFALMGLERTTFSGMIKIFWLYLSIPVSSFFMLIYSLDRYLNKSKDKINAGR